MAATLDALGPYYEYNPEEAKRLLTKAGYPDGFTMKIQWSSYTGSVYLADETVATLERNLSDVGIDVELEALEYGTWWTLNFQKDEQSGGGVWDDALFSDVGSPGYDSDSWVYWVWHSDSPLNLSHLDDPYRRPPG